MDFICELVQLIKFSPKWFTVFERFKKEITLSSGESTPSLRVLCPTSWTVRHVSISNILKNYKVLQTTLEEVQNEHDEYAGTI